jgi:hypothetical protein
MVKHLLSKKWGQLYLFVLLLYFQENGDRLLFLRKRGQIHFSGVPPSIGDSTYHPVLSGGLQTFYLKKFLSDE